ncbi:carbohydrate ABC transporter permease [Glutamicibacter sp. M10]|uniref:carbohydrate ABC transporter permease n=1 Tax=Glutamicibacter sp. M10 TaxID=3023076 RepID=UPI0021CAC362|nr:carbohydrate ABC transporter permease [Glutamicibacter sp. M10]UXN32494.1 carbohydrate ABC transporter permease [Glutamicibacter sp. M10]
MTTTAAHRATKTTAPEPIKVGRRVSPGRIVAWVVMILVIIVTLFPFYWMLRTALSTNQGLQANPASWLPPEFTFGAFERVLGLQSTEQAIAEGGSGTQLDFWRYLLNSVFVSTLITVCQLTFSAMAAFAFSRLTWPGRDKVFAIFIGGLMVPSIFTLLPNFVLIKQLGLIDNLVGIALPTMFMTPFAVFFFRQFFLNVPKEIEESALIDGVSKVGIFFRIVLPMSSSPLATLGILTYITSWNDYFWPLMVSYTDSSRVLTVALGVFRSQSPQSGTDWAGLMAATLIAALPMILLFGVFAKRIVNSIGFSGIK